MSLILDGTNGVSDIDGSASTPAIRGTDTNTGIFFPAADTIAFSEGGAEVARFDSSGNFGLGTSSPSQILDIVGTTPIINIQGGATTNARGLQFKYGSSTTTGSLTNFGGTGETALSGGASGTSGYFLTFKTDGSERMRINSSGLVMIGTTSQLINESSLAAYSTGNTCTFKTNAGSGGQPILCWNSGGGTVNQIQFFTGTSHTSAGTITSSGTSTSYGTSSDYRLKENIAPMTGALAKVQALKPVTYTWKADGSDGQGFIAHELQEICPDAVVGQKDAVDAEGKPIYQNMDTSYLVATLTAAIQEQTAIITDLKSRIEALEAK